MSSTHGAHTWQDIPRSVKPEQEVAQWLIDGKCLFLVGDGISRVTPLPEPIIPSKTELLEKIGHIVYPGRVGDSLTEDTILQLLDKADEDQITIVGQAIGRLYADQDRRPGAGHMLLSALRPDLVVTTNYDDLIEKAMRETGLNPHVISSNAELVEGHAHPPVVVKLHGDALAVGREAASTERSKSQRAERLTDMFVLTPAQYRRAAGTHKLMRLQFKLWWAQRHVVILGQKLAEHDIIRILHELQAELTRDGLIWPGGYWVDTASPGNMREFVRQTHRLDYVERDAGSFLRDVDKHRLKLIRARLDKKSAEVDVLLESVPKAFIHNCCAAVIAGDFPLDLFTWKVQDSEREHVRNHIEGLVTLGCLTASYFGDAPALRCSELLEDRVRSRMRLGQGDKAIWLSEREALQHWRRFVREAI